MPRLSFDIDWVDAEGINGPELSATWASLQIHAGDSVVTRVLDERAKTVRDFVHVPLYPLAEWLATNWWFLTHEYRNPVKEADPAFRRRHALRSGREGYAFPDLEVVSSGARTLLAWKRNQSLWGRVEFLDEGQVWTDSNEFRESCSDLVDRVIRRLASLGVEGTFLEEEWAAIQTGDKDEIEFCETAAGLGWDPYDLDDEGRENVIWLAELLDGPVLEEAIAALEPVTLKQSTLTIASAIDHAKSNRLSLDRLNCVLPQVLLGSDYVGVYPWDAGYDAARRLRRELDLDGNPLPTDAAIAEALGEDPESLARMRQPVVFQEAPLIDGVITGGEGDNPAFAFRSLDDYHWRFHFCRGIAEVLAPPSTDTLLTRAHSERQQRNRAFAAEFLAPSSGLRKKVSGPVVDAEDIDELAVEFGVSSRVIEHQVVNHGLARVL
ncbi:MAG: ImmA/IrrE family metallo-endopeptidase [Acidobacteriota bacterium]|nr:ImmA/IrrE family metallo-endopeptidase [Acidobacteriota bacterium]